MCDEVFEDAPMYLGLYSEGYDTEGLWKKVSPFGEVMEYSNFNELNPSYDDDHTSGRNYAVIKTSSQWQVLASGKNIGYAMFEFDSIENIGTTNIFGGGSSL